MPENKQIVGERDYYIKGLVYSVTILMTDADFHRFQEIHNAFELAHGLMQKNLNHLRHDWQVYPVLLKNLGQVNKTPLEILRHEVMTNRLNVQKDLARTFYHMYWAPSPNLGHYNSCEQSSYSGIYANNMIGASMMPHENRGKTSISTSVSLGKAQHINSGHWRNTSTSTPSPWNQTPTTISGGWGKTLTSLEYPARSAG